MTHASAKSVSLRIKSSGAPSEAQLAAIRSYTLADMAADDLYVRSFVIAHNAIDRDNEVMDEALLGEFASSLPGKGLFIKHPAGWDGDSGPGEGRWFAAHTERVTLDEARSLLREPGLTLPPDRTQVTLLYGDAYLVKTTENAPLLKKMDGGIAGDVSIGFNYNNRQRVLDAEGRELNVFRLTGPGEALEASLVWLGAQPGARAVKGAQRNNPENTMDPNELEAAKAKVAALEKQVSENAKAATALAALKTALGDNAALLDNPAELAECISAGKDYRADLIDTIVAGERHKGLIGDSDADVKTAKSAYAALPAAKLKVLAKTFGKAPGVKGSDPNAQAPAQEGQLTKGHAFNNPLIGGAPAPAATA